MSKDNVGDRMKSFYEDAYRIYLPRRMPMIIRLDGKAFHTLTANMRKPFDEDFIRVMLTTTLHLCKNIQNVKLAYWESDEISLLLTDYDKLTTEAWFDRNLQKMTSISSAMATMVFNKEIVRYFHDKEGMFDSRAFVIPKEEVNNYFLFRQNDCSRNSIEMLARAHFSHNSLNGLHNTQIHDKLMLEAGVNWNDLATFLKRGACCRKDTDGQWVIDYEMPILTQNRDYVNKLLEAEEV